MQQEESSSNEKIDAHPSTLLLRIEVPALEAATTLDFTLKWGVEEEVLAKVNSLVRSVCHDTKQHIRATVGDLSELQFEVLRKKALESAEGWRKRLQEAEDCGSRIEQSKVQMNTMRDAYFKEIFNLRELLYRKEQADQAGEPFDPPEQTFWDPADYVFDEEVKRVVKQKAELLEQTYDNRRRRIVNSCRESISQSKMNIATLKMLLARKDELLERKNQLLAELMRRFGYESIAAMEASIQDKEDKSQEPAATAGVVVSKKIPGNPSDTRQNMGSRLIPAFLRSGSRALWRLRKESSTPTLDMDVVNTLDSSTSSPDHSPKSSSRWTTLIPRSPGRKTSSRLKISSTAADNFDGHPLQKIPQLVETATVAIQACVELSDQQVQSVIHVASQMCQTFAQSTAMASTQTASQGRHQGTQCEAPKCKEVGCQTDRNLSPSLVSEDVANVLKNHNIPITVRSAGAPQDGPVDVENRERQLSPRGSVHTRRAMTTKPRTILTQGVDSNLQSPSPTPSGNRRFGGGSPALATTLFLSGGQSQITSSDRAAGGSSSAGGVSSMVKRGSARDRKQTRDRQRQYSPQP